MAGRRMKSQQMWQLTVRVMGRVTLLMSTAHHIRLVMTLSKTTRHGTVRAGQRRGREKIRSRDGIVSIGTVTPSRRSNDGMSAIVNTDMTASGGIATTNRDVARETVMTGIVATTAASDTGVARKTVAGDTTTITTATTATTSRRTPTTPPDARREVVPGHGEIQSHT